MNTTEPSWCVCDATDPLSTAIINRNKQDLAIAAACLPDWEECVDDVRTRLAVRLGVTETMAMHFVDVSFMLHRFSLLAEHVADGHMCIDYARRLAEYLEAVPDEHVSTVEADLLDAISAKKPNQAVPTARRLRAICQRIVEKRCPSARPRNDDDPPPPPPEERDPLLHIDSRKDTVTAFILRLNKAEAHEVNLMLDHVCREQFCDRAEAFMLLLRGETKAEITLNIYRSLDVDDGQVHVNGQWLHPLISRDWMKRVTHVAAPGWGRCEGYQPTPSIRASVIGRDGHCRFPEHRAARRTKVLADYNEQRTSNERWNARVVAAARMAAKLGTRTDETSPVQVIEALAAAYQDKYGPLPTKLQQVFGCG